MRSDLVLLGEREQGWGEEGAGWGPGAAAWETTGLMGPEVLAPGWLNGTDPDKIQPARLSPPPHTFYLLNSNHYAMNPLPLKNVNSHK